MLVCSIVCPCIAAMLIIVYTPHHWKIIIASDLFSGATAVAASSMWTVMFVSCTSQYSSGRDQTLYYLSNMGFYSSQDNPGPDLGPAFVYGPGFPILWAAAGSHLTLLIVTAVVAIFLLILCTSWMEAHAAHAARDRFSA